MSNRVSFFIAVVLLLTGASLRIWHLTALPPGFSDREYVDIALIESVRDGNISVFHQLGDEGREGLYHTIQALVTTIIGDGAVGFRILPIWFNLLTLALVYAVGKRLFGPLAGISAMALMVVSMWPIMLSRQVGREALIPFFTIAIMLTMILILPLYRKRRRRGANTTSAAVFGFFLGISLYIHPAGLLVLIFAITFAIFMIRYRENMSNRRISYISFGFLLSAIVSLPYFVSTLRLPELGGIERITGDRLNLSIKAMFDSILSLFINGDTNPLQNIPGRAMFDPVSAVIIVIGLFIVLRLWKIPRYMFLLFGLVIFAPAFLFSSNAPNFSNANSILPLFALLFGIGFSITTTWLSPSRHTTSLALSALGILMIANLFLTSDALFNQWPNLDSVQTAYNGRIGQLAHHADLTSPNIPTVICGWQPGQSNTQLTNVVSRIQLSMHRENGDVRYVDCNNAFIMTNGGETQQILIPDPTLLETSHPEIRSWLEQSVPIESDEVPSNGVLSMTVSEALADRVGAFTVSTPASLAPDISENREEIIAPPISFSNNLTFLGYIAEEVDTYKPGDTFMLITYWRIQDGVVPSDLLLFTHILSDPGASPPANTDILSLDPRYLKNRDVFLQVTRVPIPESLPDGTYKISIGAYQDTSDIRLEVLENGESRGTRLFLFDIIVQADS